MKYVPVIDSNPFEAVFLDLDGVFADMERKITEMAGRPMHEISRGYFWKLVYSKHDFFLSLDLMPDAEYLWAYVKQYKPTFLTGAPNGQHTRDQKKLWVAEKFGTEWETIVLPKREKQLHSRPNRVIIDDTIDIIDAWVAKGGHGIHHDGDVWKTIATLEELRRSYRS